MRFYDDSQIDYTLMILEYMTSRQEIHEYVNSVMTEEVALNERVDKILYRIFNTTSPELRYALVAIRCGISEIDLNEIVQEGF